MIDVKIKYDCCGCSACAQICPKQCIEMKKDNEGFDYPYVHKQNCIDCNLCIKVCPQINNTPSNKVLHAYALKHPVLEIQKNSSSGGAFSILAEYVISNGGIVFGARFNDKWDVIHDKVETLQGIKKLRMSKYVQSSINSTFIKCQKYLKTGRLVLYVGTPCQIHALKLFLSKDYDNLIAIDFVCHGVPSPVIWKKYLDSLTSQSLTKRNKHNKQIFYNNIEKIQFRNKKNGWLQFSFYLQGRLKGLNSKHIELNENFKKNPYLRGFIHDLFLRPSCYKCKNKSFKSGSDITLCDFWGIQETYPHLFDKNGISGVTINSKKGETIINNLNVKLNEVQYYDMLKYNPSFETSVTEPPFRKLFFKLIIFMPFRLSVYSVQALNKFYLIVSKTFRNE